MCSKRSFNQINGSSNSYVCDDYFLLPMSLCEHIESMISKFWCRSKQGERKVHWIKYEILFKEKRKGGMGFRTFHDFNLAFLSKQGW